MKRILLLLTLLFHPADGLAQPVDNMPRIPTEAEKRAALMLAYELNGNSMVLMGSIDLTLRKADRFPLPAPRAKQ